MLDRSYGTSVTQIRRSLIVGDRQIYVFAHSHVASVMKFSDCTESWRIFGVCCQFEMFESPWPVRKKTEPLSSYAHQHESAIADSMRWRKQAQATTKSRKNTEQDRCLLPLLRAGMTA
jgi:hypothetical protein